MIKIKIKITLKDSQQPKLSNVSPNNYVKQVYNLEKTCQIDTVESHRIGTKWTFYYRPLVPGGTAVEFNRFGTNGLTNLVCSILFE